MGNKNKNKKSAIFTKIGLGMLVLAFIVDISLYLAHASEGLGWLKWPTYALMDLIFVVVGTLGIGVLAGWKIGKDNIQTFMKFGYIFITIFLVQLAAQVLTAMSFTNFEQALYYIFAGTAEEVFFRGFLVTACLKISDKLWMKIMAVIGSTVAFAAIHVNYYANFSAMLGVILGGIVMSLYFILWHNLTANMLAHTFLNFITNFQMLVMLAAPGLVILAYGDPQLWAALSLAIILTIQTIFMKVYQKWKKMLNGSTLPSGN